LKEDASDSTPWRTRFGRGYGTVVRKVREEKRIIKIELKGVDPDSWKNGIMARVALPCRHKERSELILTL
jgi:hypothetical protein